VRPLAGTNAANHLIIIGAMKCATTTVFNLLARHPQIAPAHEKEPGYFTKGWDSGADYLDHWSRRDIEAGHYLLEASTEYTKAPRTDCVARRMREYGIQPKLIYVVRDPLDRIESDFNFSLTQWWHNPAVPPTDDRYVSISNYFLQLAQYRDFFDSGALLLIDFDDVRNDLPGVGERVAAFLEIESTFERSDPVESNVTKPATWAQRFVHGSWTLNDLFWKTPEPVRSTLTGALRLTPTAPKIRLSPQQRDTIRDALAKDIRRFGETYGFDVSKWGF